ncbi:MAG: peptidyl-prolyl cis-trans isomerase [Puniceicoccales bacterium]|jgi:hypothetical protein|nr:peptidyl-prolyl cis-trans isomerase [Puniceicoccales bacterium]
MITWLQTSLGKHHKTLLGLLLGVTIVSFVFFGAWSNAHPERGAKLFFGVDLNSARASEPYSDFAVLSALLEGRRATDDGIHLGILFSYLADTAQIPAPSPEKLKKSVEESFGGEESLRSKWALFVGEVQRLLGTSGAQENVLPRIERYFSMRWRIQQVQERLLGPGYSLPFESALEWRAQNTQWTLDTATLSAASFSPKIEPDEAALKGYFEKNKESFRIAPRITVNYAAFTPSAADQAAVTATATVDQLRNFALENAQSIPGFDLAKLDEQLKSDAGRVSLEASWREAQVRDVLVARVSMLLAEKLPVEEEAPPAEKIKQVLEPAGAALTPVGAFDETSVPTTLPVSPGILANALSLSAEKWRSDIYPSGAGVVVFFHQKTDPARIPAFEEVREKVNTGFLRAEKSRLFSEHTRTVRDQLGSAIAGGKKFAEAAQALGLTVKSHPAFKPGSPPSELSPVRDALFAELPALSAGDLAPVLRNGADALYVRIDKKETPELDLNAPEIQNITAINSRYASSGSLRSLMDELLVAETTHANTGKGTR